MATFKKIGNKNKYDFRDCDCLGRACFNAGMFNHYGTSINGANSVTNQTPECMNRAYRGCDLENNSFFEELALSRKLDGWKCTSKY